jgi:hypothetical protein
MFIPAAETLSELCKSSRCCHCSRTWYFCCVCCCRYSDICHVAPNVCSKDGHLERLVLPPYALRCASFPTVGCSTVSQVVGALMPNCLFWHAGHCNRSHSTSVVKQKGEGLCSGTLSRTSSDCPALAVRCTHAQALCFRVVRTCIPYHADALP